MIRTRIAGLSLVCLFLAHPAAAQQPAAPAIPSDAPVIKVLSTGSGPKRALRYKIPPASAGRINLTMKMSMTMGIEGMGSQSMDMPGINMGIDIDVTSVASNGDISYGFAFSGVTMEGPGLPAGAFDAIKGLGGTVTVSDRGIMRDMTFDVDKIADPALRQMLTSSGVDKLSSPLPEEPVGVGARWEVIQTVVTNGIRMDQKGLYELLTLDDSAATMAVTMEQTAGAQTFEPAGMPPGAQVSLVSLAGNGSGRMTLPPNALALYGEMDMKSKLVMDVSAEGESQRMSTETGMKMKIAAGKR